MHWMQPAISIEYAHAIVTVWVRVVSCIERVLPAYHNEKIITYDQLGQIRVLAGKIVVSRYTSSAVCTSHGHMYLCHACICNLFSPFVRVFRYDIDVDAHAHAHAHVGVSFLIRHV